ncbi:MAG: RimK/LysX family protein [Bacteroidota bacterium]
MKTIGRLDKIDLPDLGLTEIDAKVDTGAYGCSLHCHHIETIVENGVPHLTFKVLDPSHDLYENRIFKVASFNEKVVKSSTGQAEHRYTIKTHLVIFNKKWKVEFSLTDRKEMKYPILLGRKFLSGKFLVDVQQKNLSHKEKK